MSLELGRASLFELPFVLLQLFEQLLETPVRFPNFFHRVSGLVQKFPFVGQGRVQVGQQIDVSSLVGVLPEHRCDLLPLPLQPVNLLADGFDRSTVVGIGREVNRG